MGLLLLFFTLNKKINKLSFVILTIKELINNIKCYINNFIEIFYSIYKNLITLYLYMLILKK